MKSLTKEKRYDIINAYISTSTCRYLDDLLNIGNIHFEEMVHIIYPAELQFINKMYRLLNVYRKIFGTSSYGEDARALRYTFNNLLLNTRKMVIL